MTAMAAFSNDFSHRSLTLIHVPGFLARHGVRATPVFQHPASPPSDLSDPETWIPATNVSRSRLKPFAHQRAIARTEIGQRLSTPPTWDLGQDHLGSAEPDGACNSPPTPSTHLQLGTVLRHRQAAEACPFHARYLGGSRHEPDQHVLGSLVVLRKIALLAGEPVRSVSGWRAILRKTARARGVSRNGDRIRLRA